MKNKQEISSLSAFLTILSIIIALIVGFKLHTIYKWNLEFSLIISVCPAIFLGFGIGEIVEKYRNKKQENEFYDVDEKPSRYIPTRVKRKVWRRDQGRCMKCGSQRKLEYDHIVPLSKGGSNTVRNIQLLCEECNRKKSNMIG